MIPELTPYERGMVDHMKAICAFLKQMPITSFPPEAFQRGGEAWLAAIAISEMATERSGVSLQNIKTGEWYSVPAGTPWEECLPVEWPKD